MDNTSSDLNLLSLLKRNCTVWNYIKTSLQGPTSVVYGKYCSLFVLYMDRGYTPKESVSLFTAGIADSQNSQLFIQTFGSLCGSPTGG